MIQATQSYVMQKPMQPATFYGMQHFTWGSRGQSVYPKTCLYDPLQGPGWIKGLPAPMQMAEVYDGSECAHFTFPIFFSGVVRI